MGPAGGGAGLAVFPAEFPQVEYKKKTSGTSLTLSGWGFEPGEAFIASLVAEGGNPQLLSGGVADDRGVIYNAPAKSGKPVNLVPALLKPGNYLITVAGSSGTMAHTTFRLLEPVTEPKPSAGPGIGLAVFPAALPQSDPKAKNEARAFVTLSGWGFQPGEAWVAFMELNEGSMELNEEGPTILTNGNADDRGVVYAEPWKKSKPRGLVPASLKPGNYLVTMEGTGGTTAHATLTILDPLPTA
jgi:hypothetical protein